MKRRYTKKEDIPAGMEAAYKEVNGAWELDLEDGNEELELLKRSLEGAKGDKKKLQERIAMFDGIDPEIARQLIEQHTKAGEKKLLDEGKVEELFKTRIEKMVSDHEKTVKGLNDKLGGLSTRLKKELIDNRLMLAAQKAGVKASAVPDVLSRGRTIYDLNETMDDIVARDSKGAELYGKNGKVLQPEEWMTTLAEEAEHLFERGNGSGAPRDPNQTGGQHTIRRSEARDPGRYAQAKDAAAKAGVQLQIVD